jgi:hypothetical protein
MCHDNRVVSWRHNHEVLELLAQAAPTVEAIQTNWQSKRRGEHTLRGMSGA